MKKHTVGFGKQRFNFHPPIEEPTPWTNRIPNISIEVKGEITAAHIEHLEEYKHIIDQLERLKTLEAAGYITIQANSGPAIYIGKMSFYTQSQKIPAAMQDQICESIRAIGESGEKIAKKFIKGFTITAKVGPAEVEEDSQ